MESEFLANLSEEEKIAKLPTYIAILQNIIKEQKEELEKSLSISEIKSEYNVDEFHGVKYIDVYTSIIINSIHINIYMYIDNLVYIKHKLEKFKQCLDNNPSDYYRCGPLHFIGIPYGEPNQKSEYILIDNMEEETGNYDHNVTNIKIYLDNKKNVDAFIEYIDELLAFIENEQKNNE